MDEEVHYLGMKPAPSRAALDISSFSHKAAIGIVLHDNSPEPSRNKWFSGPLKFYKKDSTVVQIGRRSSTESSNSDNQKNRALFRCAVVSRAHAKIAFTDSGSAYLIDLNSHHGTLHRKVNDPSFKRLVRDIPIVLSDGDVITFGKTVGRDHDVVSPVVVRVEMLYGPNPADPPVSASPRPVATGCVQNSKSTGSTRSRGRYGLYAALYSSRDNSPSRSTDDDESDNNDVEEESNEPTRDDRSPSPRQNQGSSLSLFDMTLGARFGSRAMEAFKFMLPPVRLHCPPIVTSGSTTNVDEDRRSPSIGRSLQSPLPGSDDQEICERTSYYSESSSEHSYVHASPVHSTASKVYPVDIDDESNESSEKDAQGDEDIRSKSSTPMELATPSPIPSSPPRQPTPHHEYVPPEFILTADPFMWGDPWESASSRFPPPLSLPVLSPLPPVRGPSGDHDNFLGLISEPNLPTSDSALNPSPAREVEHEVELSREHTPVVEMADAQNEGGCEEAPAAPSGSEVLKPAPETSTAPESKNDDPRVVKLERTVSQLMSDVDRLQQHRRKYRARFNTNVQIITQQMNEFDDRINDQTTQYDSLFDEVQCLSEELPDIYSRLDSLEVDVSNQEEDMEKTFSEAEQAKETLQVVKELLHEMRSLHNSTSHKVELETEEVKITRDAVLENLRTLQEQIQEFKSRFESFEGSVQAQPSSIIFPPSPAASPTASPVKSNKRKRPEDNDDDDDDDLILEGEKMEIDGHSDQESKSPVVCTVTKPIEVEVVTNSTLVRDRNGNQVPSPKRARRVAKAVLKTAGAVTLGAVVTWSALAFS